MEKQMPGHDIIVVGASAGGVEALSRLVHDLPPDLPAAIFIVLHVPAHGTSVLPNILNRYGSLKAWHPTDGAQIQHGRIYVAPPNYHLLVKRGYITLARGPRENSHRPAADPLFRTAARYYGRRVVGVVLSGNLDDGTAGLQAVKMRGGVAIVQNPDEALFNGMPRSAIENVQVDHILPLPAIAPVLVRLAHEPVEEEGANPVTGDMEMESDMAELDLAALQKHDRPGTPSGFACPECAGVLWELRDGELIRFRCRTGHAYSVESLLAEQSEALETALWSALRALEERAALADKMLKRARDSNLTWSVTRHEEQVKDAQKNAAIIREVLLKGGGNGENGKDDSGENRRNSPSPLISEVSSFSKDVTVSTKYLVAIAASAGGVKALSQLLSSLPKNFPAAITVVQHLDPHHPSQLADILSSRTPVSVRQAKQGEQLRPATVYIAPPNYHLLVNPDHTLSLTQTQLVNFVRPSADLLFESVAASFKERAIAVILTGKGRDGADGLKAIKQMGGKAIAQDRASSDSFGMPGAAIDTGFIDLILPLNEIAAALSELTSNGNW